MAKIIRIIIVIFASINISTAQELSRSLLVDNNLLFVIDLRDSFKLNDKITLTIDGQIMLNKVNRESDGSTGETGDYFIGYYSNNELSISSYYMNSLTNKSVFNASKRPDKISLKINVNNTYKNIKVDLSKGKFLIIEYWNKINVIQSEEYMDAY